MSETVKDLVMQKQAAIQEVVSPHVDAKRWMRLALGVALRPKLAKCDPTSVVQALTFAADLGLDCWGGPHAEGWLIPYREKIDGQQVLIAQFIPSYRGLASLAKRAGAADRIKAHCVYEGDQFEAHFGTDERLIHVPGDETRPDKITHAYAVAWLPDGRGTVVEVLTRVQIERARKASKQPNGVMWGQYYDRAAEKSAVRRLVNWLDVRREGPDARRFQAVLEKEAESDVDLGPDGDAAAVEEEGSRVKSLTTRVQGAEGVDAPKVEGGRIAVEEDGDEITTPKPKRHKHKAAEPIGETEGVRQSAHERAADAGAVAVPEPKAAAVGTLDPGQVIEDRFVGLVGFVQEAAGLTMEVAATKLIQWMKRLSWSKASLGADSLYGIIKNKVGRVDWSRQ